MIPMVVKDSTEDSDDDNDGVLDAYDDCSAYTSDLGWISNQATTDYDADGCQDSSEDADDDNDGVLDLHDLCPESFGWTSNSQTDYDSDGCRDSSEDADDDNDGIYDTDEFTTSPWMDFVWCQ